MTPERWAQIDKLFHRAAECNPDQRELLLDEACSGDSQLRREVEDLLTAEKNATHSLRAAVSSALEEVSFPLVGQTIAHYRILDGIGGGGMGLVYRAEDIRLKRQVALKFLPEHAANDPAALGRFEREARSSSALEHPSICPIYEFGEYEGRSFIVMPLLEGKTLRELLSAAPAGRSPLTLERLLDFAIQIGDGLAAAHKSGVIHRDIKPANIFVTNQGQAKILDFGLAKPASPFATYGNSIEADFYDGSEEGNPTETMARESSDAFLSRAGMAMGTAGYMSPEQARGEKLDLRTDVFSFGLVLYEMATGQRAFEGNSGLVRYDAILTQVPAPVCQLNPRIPAKLEKIINKALEKQREARYQSAPEIRAELQSLKREIEHRSRWRELTAGVVVILLITGVIYWSMERRRLPAQDPPKLNVQQLTFNSFENRVTTGAISPDGKYLAYSDLNGMHIKLLETGTIKVVPWPEGFNNQNTQWEIIESAWFPDSARFIANAHPAFQPSEQWSSKDASIWIISTRDEVPRRLRDKAIAWSISPDGASIAFGKNRGRLGDREIWLMTQNGETERKVLETDEDSWIGVYQWVPGGQRVSYTKFDEHGATAYTTDLSGRPPAKLFTPSESKNMNSFLWLPDGRLLYPQRENGGYHTCNFWTQRLDSRTGQLIDKPTRLTNWSGSCMDFMSVTTSGKRLAFLKITQHMTSYLADLSAGGTRLVNLRHFPESESSEGIADWTPDSKELIVVSNRANDYFGMYRQSLNEETAIPLDTKGYGRSPCVTPDGKWILYLGYGGNEQGWWEPKAQPLLRVPVNGGPAVALFTARPGTFSITCARPPAKLCAIDEPSEDGKEWVIAILDPLSGRGSELARFPVDSNGGPWWAQLSPDGTRIAVSGFPADSIQILLLRGHSSQELKIKGWSNLEKPTWASDGRGLYVSADGQSGKVILYVNLQGNTHVVWEGLKATQETLALPSPDGRHLAIQTMTDSNNIWLMENF